MEVVVAGGIIRFSISGLRCCALVFFAGMVTSKVGKRHALTGFEVLKELFVSRFTDAVFHLYFYSIYDNHTLACLHPKVV